MALLDRWYAFGPWLLILLLVARRHGAARALALGLGGWLIVFAAEWSSTRGPGIPFGAYSYRSAGLVGDWRLLGVPIFDSLSFTWLASSAYLVAGWLGARGAVRLALTALGMVAVDLVVDPVALRGGRWWLGSIYSYPRGAGVWYGVSALNYVGWLVVGLALALWLMVCLGPGVRSGVALRLAALVLLAGTLLQGLALSIWLGIAPAGLAALGLAALCAGGAWLARPRWSRLPPPQLVVACALAAEARVARRALGGRWRDPEGPLPRAWRTPDHALVEVLETGLGQAAADRARASVPAAARVLVAGVGAACRSGWEPGETAVGQRLRGPGGDWRELDPEASRALLAAGAGRAAALGSLSAPASGRDELEQLGKRGVDLVEMETWAWTGQGSVAALRTVLDGPFGPAGRAAGLIPEGASSPQAGAVVRLLLRHPESLGQLRTLGARQRLALASLSRALQRAVPALLYRGDRHDEPVGPAL